MDIENDGEAQTAVDEAEMQAAFAAEFNAPPAPDKAEPELVEEAQVEAKAEEVKPAVQDTPIAPPTQPNFSDEQLKLLAAIPELERRLTQQVDKVAGNYGEIKRLLEATQKAAATPKSAAEFDASEDGDYLDTEFPELAGGVAAKIDKAVKGIQTGISPEKFEELYQERRRQDEDRNFNELREILDSYHPDRLEIQKSIHWPMWFASFPAHQQKAMSTSQDPYYLAGMFDKFKEYRANKEAEAKKSQKRIENAVAPTGVKVSGKSTVSEDEAMQMAFAEQFK